MAMAMAMDIDVDMHRAVREGFKKKGKLFTFYPHARTAPPTSDTIICIYVPL